MCTTASTFQSIFSQQQSSLSSTQLVPPFRLRLFFDHVSP